MSFTGKRTSTLDICNKRCDQCLFSSAKIVSNDRKEEILRELEEKGGHFSCHKHTLADRDVVCRGDYDRDPMRTAQSRLGARLGLLRFINQDGDEV